MNGLRQHVSNSRTQTSQSGYGDVQQAQLSSIAADAIALKTELARLQDSLRAEIAARDRALSTKADAHTTEKQMDAFNFALNTLESRYENITTDDLYQRMVHWFVQMYPSNATMLRNYERIQQDVNQLKTLEPQISWIQIQSKELSTLIHNAPQLQGLINIAPQIQAIVEAPIEWPQALVMIDQACFDAKTAVTKAEEAGVKVGQQTEKVESIRSALSGLQTSFHNLNSKASPFAKAEMLSKLEKTIKALEVQLGAEEEGRLYTMNELRTTLGKEHDTRVEVEKQLKSSIHELKQMKGALDPKVVEQVCEIEVSLSQLRKDFDMINNTLIEPNRDFFGLFGTTLTVVAQLQKAVESLNENLPVDPLKFEWEYYLPKLGQPEASSDTGKGKGRGKSK
jgi:hypothetical protein